MWAWMGTTNRFWSNKFFRLTLRNSDVEDITKLLRSLEQEKESIERDISSLVYYMNGGLNFIDAYGLEIQQMSRMTDVINKHYEKQAESYKKSR